jgi:hypothetical protein
MIHSWSTAVGPGNPSYSLVLHQSDGIDKKFVLPSHLLHIFADKCIYRLLLSATTFIRHPKYPVVNLSRVDPAFVSTGMHGKKHFHRVGNDQPLLCTSVVVVDQCHLNEGKVTAQGRLQKLVKASLLEGEFERLVGVIGMIIGEREFKGQLYKNVLDFTTFTDTGNGRSTLYFLCMAHVDRSSRCCTLFSIQDRRQKEVNQWSA